MSSIDAGDTSALLGRRHDYRGGNGPRNNMRRKGPIDKRNTICEHCGKVGHGNDTCFKLHGVLDWYKELTDKKKRNGGRAYAVSDDLSDHSSVPAGSMDMTTTAEGNLVTELMEL
ncbi:UNVERIFIED_CONTAM: hypothetical protein Slati_0086500 [Sesamum latifolium]|uniref:CCHC-type domain-containing protein n=1 Tax=Sesamum latifolium TaxID=2727402 RepID=A0AAW2Y8A6_9LAMI